MREPYLLSSMCKHVSLFRAPLRLLVSHDIPTAPFTLWPLHRNAHKNSTVQDADRIIVLSAGRIREEGTHAQLLEKGGLYRSLVERQLREEEVAKCEAAVEG